ncbi:hypothetical protein K7432_000739 [Basidiobolus ranarum]|uniref:F-box/LRR-repeat protein 15-like leucin rich repeat domain-containing protein n=1 Tax=Basidiobolus ranarum TaxID=34480 RepID=A0ABR2X426_9FUNG
MFFTKSFLLTRFIVLFQIAERCTELTSLSVQSCHKISNEGLSAVITRCSKLVELSIVHCRQINNKTIRKVIKYSAPNLISFTLRRCSRIDQAILSKLGTACENLRTLELTLSYYVNPAVLKSFANIPTLTTLRVGVADPTEDIFELEELLDPLTGFQSLTALYLSFPNLQPAFLIRLILALKKLRFITILGSQFITENFQKSILDEYGVVVSFF